MKIFYFYFYKKYLIKNVNPIKLNVKSLFKVVCVDDERITKGNCMHKSLVQHLVVTFDVFVL